MITALIIKDFAIIERLELVLSEGMTVLSGETGAGKSIVIDALNLVLGGRASAEVIRHGSDEAVVEAVFYLGPGLREQLLPVLESSGVPCEEELVVRRVIHRGGRGRAWLNAVLVPVQVLRAAMRAVVDISGQHEHVSLMDVGRHVTLLDRYAGHATQLAAYGTHYRRLREGLSRLTTLREACAARQARLTQLDEEIAALAAVAPETGEVARLEAELHELSHAEQLRAVAHQAIDVLYEREGSVTDRLHQTETELQRHARLAASLSTLGDQLATVRTLVTEAVFELRRFATLESDLGRIDWIQSRLALLERTQRRFLCEADALPAVLAQLQAEREALVSGDESVAALEKQIATDGELALRAAIDLSQRRAAAAQTLEAAVERSLHDLAMERARFVVGFTGKQQVEDLGPHGLDQVEFLLAPNPGDPPRPLARIASGGELSRVMLAIKEVMADNDDVGTYVFDEVDAGIGGATATCVAAALKRVSANHQVLCITHLATIASFADHHFAVVKSSDGERALCSVAKLNEEERTREVARMLGGLTITTTTMDHAAELIDRARAPGTTTGCS